MSSSSSTSFKNLRRITQVFSPEKKAEGNGASVQRIIGGKNLKRLDPFLMLDYAHVKLPAGFPDHPHRGFETVSYMLEGNFLHEDSKGNKGSLGPGDIQWMTAGKGIVHAEMPSSFTQMSVGFQLWLNLEKKNKMCEPAYQELKAEKIPIIQKPGIWIRLIAGTAYGVTGPIYTRTPAFYMDVHLEKSVDFEQHVPVNFQGLVFVYDGSITIGGNKEKAGKNQAAVFLCEDGETLNVRADELTGAKFILFAGKPIKEPIFHYGPFVLDSQDALNTTFEDYSESKNGFEDVGNWKSEIQFIAKQKLSRND